MQIIRELLLDMLFISPKITNETLSLKIITT